MRLRIAAFLFILFASAGLYAIDIKNIVAYPVPFNPKTGILSVGFDPLFPDPASYNVKIAIFDINGDPVTEISSSRFPVKWNGRNSSGRHVKPGMYIIRVTAETDSGDYGRKNIRILVNY